MTGEPRLGAEGHEGRRGEEQGEDGGEDVVTLRRHSSLTVTTHRICRNFGGELAFPPAATRLNMPCYHDR